MIMKIFINLCLSTVVMGQSRTGSPYAGFCTSTEFCTATALKSLLSVGHTGDESHTQAETSRPD